MKFLDRLLTITITALITSAVWILAGESLIEFAQEQYNEDEAGEGAPASPESSPQPPDSEITTDKVNSLNAEAGATESESVEPSVTVPDLPAEGS